MEDEKVLEAVRCLDAGGVLLVPTDTVYGLAASPLHPDAVDRIFALKRRPGRVRLPVMVSSVAMLRGIGAVISPAAERLLNSRLVPGALTLAVGIEGPDVPPWLSGRDEIAVRIPDDARLLAILARAGPLFVTSANAHGAGTPETMAECLAQLDGAPDLAIDGGPRRVVPSTLVNCRADPPVVEREGAVPTAEIEKELA